MTSPATYLRRPTLLIVGCGDVGLRVLPLLAPRWRVLALEHRLEALGTVERLRAMANQLTVAPALVRDLIETLHMLMALKLRNNLRQLSLGQTISNLVELSSLGTLDRDQLTDALGIIRQFKQFLRHHYRLES